MMTAKVALAGGVGNRNGTLTMDQLGGRAVVAGSLVEHPAPGGPAKGSGAKVTPKAIKAPTTGARPRKLCGLEAYLRASVMMRSKTNSDVLAEF
jgi:hypothetical protein